MSPETGGERLSGPGQERLSESGGERLSGPGQERLSESGGERLSGPGQERLSRLDPDLAASSARAQAPPASAGPVRKWPARRTQLLAGLLAAVVLLAIVLLSLGGQRSVTVGVAPGGRLPLFAAPLAGTTLVGDANLRPPCATSHHDPRAMNLCLLVSRGPLALLFFVPSKSQCVRAVDTFQMLAARLGGRGLQFAAVAVDTGPKAAAAAVRSHRWLIPVAYDRDGAVGASYGAVVCPLIELSRRGGVVFARLIGNHWLAASALTAQLDRLASG